MRILVLGGYGLIGLSLVKRLHKDGHEVIGLGRSMKKGHAAFAPIKWHSADIANLTTPQAWTLFLQGIEVVINAAGVLQDGLNDNVVRVQRDSICALITACTEQNIGKFVQISAPGVEASSGIAFYSSKAEADLYLKNSTLNWTIFRPGLVVSPYAYGGTSLLRMLAAVPVVQPVIMANAPIQTVAIKDVCEAVSLAVQGEYPCTDYDLVEASSHSLKEVVLMFRQWLGFSPPKFTLHIPPWLGNLSAKGADLAGWLGWRSALRTTALKVMQSGVTGNSEKWHKDSATHLSSLPQTLQEMPSTVQERIYARATLAFPFLLLTLAIFWLASGIIGLVQYEKAMLVMADKIPATINAVFVRGGGFFDIIIGLMLLIQRFAKKACLLSILGSSAYIVGSVLFAPQLWVDPLGPMVKVIPVIALSAITLALMQER